MIVNGGEQLRERRRVLAALIAVGIRRRTLTGSIFYQVAVPVILGMLLAVTVGSALAAALMLAVGTTPRVDWVGIGVTTSIATLVVLLTTAAGLPTLWRLTRPANLRSE
jgi:ABC-type antimicrobial peptide transport system permease subunit